MELLTTVERYYGKHVRLEPLESLEGHGLSGVAADGTPVIRLNAKTGLTEENIAHELFHLKMSAEGTPDVAYQYGASGHVFKDLLENFLHTYLRSTILHWMFFPEMRKMGFAADTQAREEYKELLRRCYYTSPAPGTDEALASVFCYFKARLELADAGMLERLRAWYAASGRETFLTLGEELARHVVESNPRLPDEEIAVFVRCLNSSFAPPVGFEVVRRAEKIIGSHRRSLVVIGVSNTR